jgi:hypothetical protein
MRRSVKIKGMWTPVGGLRAQARVPTKRFLLNSGED